MTATSATPTSLPAVFPNMPSGTVPAMRELLQDIAALVPEHQGTTGDQR